MKALFETLGPLDPIPTDQAATFEPIENIKSVVFDIYGTLLISASGDIGSSELVGQTALRAFNECSISFKRELPDNVLGPLIVAEYEEAIIRHHTVSKDNGIPFPEVDIIEIWQDVINELIAQGIVDEQSNIDYEKLSITFEIFNNPIYPMPNMNETLETIHSAGFSLGIVSNAQYFTPMLLNHFMKNDEVYSDLPLFNPDICVYSYKHKRAKPDTWLYENLLSHLEKKNIKAKECLYIGNDMLNDIYPASQVGLNTVLYAGDIRSLRLRKNIQETKDLKPDRTITELKQILNLLQVQ